MKKQFLIFLFLLSLAASVSAQTKEARKIDEFGFKQCGEFNARVDVILQTYINDSDSKIYVIYYEEKSHNVLKKTKTGEKIAQENPRRGNALNRAKEIVLYAEARKNDYLKYIKESGNNSTISPKIKSAVENIVLIDGGYREEFIQEIWIVPNGAKAPIPTPTLQEKDIKFAKGKPRRSRQCARAYDMYENPNF
jgi:hypothetical protein